MRGIKQHLILSVLLTVFFSLLFSFFNFSFSAEIITTTDPTRIGVGARALGMGKAFVGLADDSTAIFMNPAGIANLKDWQITSMSTKLINEIDYLTFGGIYATEYGNFGFGYVGASIGGSFITSFDIVEDPDGRIYVVSSSEALNYGNNVMLFSYGNHFKNMPYVNFDFLKDVSFGTNLKLFSQSLSGLASGEGNATGMDVDMGLLYRMNDWMSIGFNAIDSLPMSMGGKMVFSGASEEAIPPTYKIGTAIRVMGDKALYQSDQQLYYLLDMDYRPMDTETAQLFHTGLEYWPNENLALRFGIDQDIAGRGSITGVDVISNMCAGVGFLYEGFRFDYAFHQYGGSESNDTHYISMSYGFLPPPAEVVPEQPKTYFQLTAPIDKTTLYDEKIKITGYVTELKDVRRLTINDVEVPITFDGSFEASTSLSFGKNVFEAKAFDADGKLLKSEKIRLLRLIQFKDVPETYWAKEPVEMLAVLGMIGGYPDNTFRPDKKISRSELTTLLVRAKGVELPKETEKLFKDLPKSHWAAKYVQVGLTEKLVTGYPDKTFRPNKSVTRAEGVTVLTRFAGLELPELIVEGPFADIPGRHWAAKSISAAKSSGMLNYLAGKPFEGNKDMTRAEAVEILSKTPFAATKMQDLTNFDAY